jgi:alanine racemase
MAFIKINKQNFYHNLNQIALKTGSIEKIAIVLKDNAYGHGLELMAKLASDFGIQHAVVRKTTEADRIRDFFKTILILGDTIVKDEKYTFALNSIGDIDNAQEGASVELKVDTGMHRNGIGLDEVDEAFKRIQKNHLNLVGVMTHYRSADELSSELFWQQKRFDEVKAKAQKAGLTKVRFHSRNTAAILRSKSFDEDLVRVGIGAYGYHDLYYPFDQVLLKPVLSLHAKRISSRELKAGERIGYGGDFVVDTSMKVSTYDLGYGDGWCRGDSKTPFVTAEGLPILGRVSMDFISLGSDQEEICVVADAQDAAKQFGTISYEITTSLSSEIERQVVE